MRNTLRRFFTSYAHSAVTAADLLCHLSHALAGCPVVDAGSLGGCKPPQPTPPPPKTLGAANATAQDAVVPADSCGMVEPWRQRLDAWLVAPGVQVVEVSQQSASTDSPTQLQALLRPDELPGQVRCHARLPAPVAGFRSEHWV